MRRPVIDHAAPPRSGRLPLSAWLALAYTLLIAHASLSPFAGWRLPTGGVFGFLGTWPRYLTGFDLAINLLAYVPLGVLLAQALAPRLGPRGGALAAAMLGAAVSLAMEALQTFMPGRIASSADLLANGGGAACGALFALLLQRPALERRLRAIRHRLFLQGLLADWGLALLLLWLFGQTNPSLPLMGNWLAEQPLAPLPQPFSFAQMAAVALNLLALGLIATLLLQPGRSPLAIAVTALLLAAALKAAAAALLLKPEAAAQWLSREAVIGAGYGLAALSAASLLRLRGQAAAAALALGATLLLAWEARGGAFTAAPLWIFGWHHGHLLGFTGLTQSIAGIWPLLALAWLGAFYSRAGGRPPAP